MLPMNLNSVIFQIGTRPVTLLELLLAASTLALLLLLLVTIFVWRAQRSRSAEKIETARRTAELEYRLAELSGAMQGFAAQAQGQQMQLQHQLNERLDQVGQRVGHGLNEQGQRTAQSLAALGERLAVIDAAQANLTQLSGEMISLKNILNNKQTRGAFGQGRMEAIITDGLHSKAYEFQATLSNGTRPDCVISLPDSALRLVIDAKFPLEAYNAMRAAEDEPTRKGFEAQLKSDMARHVRDIAEKYLITGETHETAILFVPSESVYAELNERFEDVVQKAHRSRVILASPNVLMLLVQTMQAIIKDASMREQAHVIQGEVVKLLEDVSRLKERAGDLRKHFDQANGDIEKITMSADKITKRGLRIESLDLAPNENAAAVELQRPRLVN
jgi:DNA recombination protein RmuC